jgi:hypothetical protein
VYLNWMLSQEGQTLWSKASGYASRRMDVPTDHLHPATLPQSGQRYVSSFNEEFKETEPDVTELLKQLLPS